MYLYQLNPNVAYSDDDGLLEIDLMYKYSRDQDVTVRVVIIVDGVRTKVKITMILITFFYSHRIKF